MGMKMCGNRTGLMLAVFATAAVVTVGSSRCSADESAAIKVLKKPAPESAADLRTMEQHFTDVAKKVIPCTVALQVGMAQASGVVVSADGYVLTAAHVIGRPGRDAKIIFPDGSVAQGKTLGLNPEVDGGLVKISTDGPWPFAPLAPVEEAPKSGDWCLSTGHPGGYQPGRSPPVRLGRVIDSERAVIRTDCVISMGDSGGPLFDMQGRVIGIHSRITEQTSMNLHVPGATFQEVWEVLKAGEIAAREISSRFLARLDPDGDGKISREEVAEGFYRQVFDRMVTTLELDPEKTHTVDDLRKALGLTAPRNFDPRNLPLPTLTSRPGETLPRNRFAHGRSVRSAFGEVVAEIRNATVRIDRDGNEVATGTIVDADGWIVTKASELAGAEKIACVLADSRELPARLVGVDSSHDLALLQVEATKLKSIPSKEAPELKPGMWLASLGRSGEPPAVGVVSVAERRISRSPGVLGVIIDDREEGPVVRQIAPSSGAATAGVKEGDLITHIATEPVHNLAELQAAVRKHRVGDVIRAAIKRDDKESELAVRLGMPEDSFGGPIRVSGPLSNRRDDFPAVIQHDTVLRPADCGGPVVDLAGNVVGINIARADRTASLALPIAAIGPLVEKLKSSEPAANKDPKVEK